MMRVTGRFESEEQQLAPWGHGPSFTIDKVCLLCGDYTCPTSPPSEFDPFASSRHCRCASS